jgi:endonuclease/exonuclease/phosphatase family metal-dependent hydrolase
VGTFNLNNLFSRFNFTAEIPPEEAVEIESKTTFTFSDPTAFKLRTFQGRLVKGKPDAARATLAARIKAMDLDVIGVQEVEDVNVLVGFARTELAELGYKHVVLVEGNDARLIDVGIMSRLPIGAVTSWRHAVHPKFGEEPVFSRDLLEVDILNAARSKRLFTVYNTHLKSHFVPFNENQETGTADANARRQRQAEVIARIVSDRQRPKSAFVVMGDMNDPPESPFLAPLRAGLPLVDGLANAMEDRQSPAEMPMAPTTPWTHRFKEAGKPADHQLFDHVWLSRSLADRLTAARINRRTKLGGDGSDHDPAWVELAF